MSETIDSAEPRRSRLRLMPALPETELTQMARRDPELLDFLRFLVAYDLREEALELLRGAKHSDPKSNG